MSALERTEPEERAIARLLPFAESTAALPAERSARIRRAVEAHWRARLDARPARGRRLRLSLAAAALAAAALVWLRPGEELRAPSGAPVAATVLRVVRGGAEATQSGALRPGGELRPGQALETDGATRVALALANGSVLHVDGATRLRFLGADVVELERGALYLDSGPEGSGRPVAVRAAGATVREIGTQYEVRRRDSGLRVSVREGRVALEAGEASVEAEAAERVELRPNGEIEASRIDPWDADWDWTLELVEPVDFDGRTLGEFLDWAGRQTGWTVRFDPPSLEASARAARLHGSLSGSRAVMILPDAVAACALDHELARGVLTLREADPARAASGRAVGRAGDAQ